MFIIFGISSKPNSTLLQTTLLAESAKCSPMNGAKHLLGPYYQLVIIYAINIIMLY